MRETIVAFGDDGKYHDVNIEVCAKFDLAITDDAWSLRGKSPSFVATVIITEHAKQAYIRFGSEGFFRKLDRSGPLTIEIMNHGRVKE